MEYPSRCIPPARHRQTVQVRDGLGQVERDGYIGQAQIWVRR